MKSFVTLLCSIFIIGASCPLYGQDDDASTLKHITTMSDSFMVDVRAFNKKMFDAKDDQERADLENNAKPDPAELFEELIALIKKDPQNSVVVPAAARTVLMFHRMRKQDIDLPYIFDTIDKHHINNPDIALTVMISVYQRGYPAAETFIKTAYQNSTNDLVRAVAAFGLSQLPGTAGDEQIAYLETSLSKISNHEEFTLPNGRRLKEMVEGRLRSLKLLGIGMVAPEIEGEDIEGVNFKLSDYRGKVVLLDFWGHW